VRRLWPFHRHGALGATPPRALPCSGTHPSNEVPETPVAPKTTALPAAGAPSLRLEPLGGGIPLTIPPQAVLGQDHPSGDATVRLPLALEGVAYVHRRHCRFLQAATGWTVEAIDQAPQGGAFTNPTRLNGAEIPPGEHRPLREGDELRLAGVVFRVRISRSRA
jgi:hypothetical protein